MLKNILSASACAQCRICCEYDDSDIWDAPGFSEDEWQEAGLEGRFPYEKRGSLYYLVMEKDEKGLYHCPCLSDTGCILGEHKPFRCALWPLYVVRTGDGLALAVSDVCPAVFPKTDAEILEGLRDNLHGIRKAVEKDPALIEELHENYRLLAGSDGIV